MVLKQQQQVLHLILVAVLVVVLREHLVDHHPLVVVVAHMVILVVLTLALPMVVAVAVDQDKLVKHPQMLLVVQEDMEQDSHLLSMILHQHLDLELDQMLVVVWDPLDLLLDIMFVVAAVVVPIIPLIPKDQVDTVVEELVVVTTQLQPLALKTLVLAAVEDGLTPLTIMVERVVPALSSLHLSLIHI